MRHHGPMSSFCLIALALVIVATVVLPRPLADAGLEAFRKELAAIVKRRSKTDLIKLVVPQGFFWEGDFGGSFEAGKSSADNFVRAFHFDHEGGDAWDR